MRFLMVILMAAACAGAGSAGDPTPGSLDASFGEGGKLILAGLAGDAEARAVAVQPGDGRILVAGVADRAAGSGRDGVLLRLEPDGRLDASFGAGGIVRVSAGDRSALNALTLLADGRIGTVGAAKSPSGDDDLLVALFDGGGVPVPGFGSGGVVVTRVSSQHDRAYAVARDLQDRMVVAGTTLAGHGSRALVARYDAAGNPDPLFNGGAPVLASFGRSDSDCRAVATDSLGRIVAAGSTVGREQGAPVEAALLRLTDTGALDPGFGTDGIRRLLFSSLLAWRSLAILDQDLILAGGDAVLLRESRPLELRLAVARFSESGALDAAFGAGGLTTVPLARAAFGTRLLRQADGRIAACGTAVRSSSDFVAVRLREDGAIDPDFGDGGAVKTNLARDRKRGTSQDAALAAALQPDGKIVLAGSTNAGARRRTRIALVRYHP